MFPGDVDEVGGAFDSGTEYRQIQELEGEAVELSCKPPSFFFSREPQRGRTEETIPWGAQRLASGSRVAPFLCTKYAYFDAHEECPLFRAFRTLRECRTRRRINNHVACKKGRERRPVPADASHFPTASIDMQKIDPVDRQTVLFDKR
jgi:hypothetical protein